MISRFFLLSTILSIPLAAPGRDRDGTPPERPARAQAPGPGGAGIFVPNLGQWRNPFRYSALFPDARAFFLEKGWVLAFREGSLLFRFIGSKRVDKILPGKRLHGVYNFFLGKDPSRWRRGVPLYDSVRYTGIYPGMDLVFLERGGRLAFDLSLRPGADLSLFALQVRGGDVPGIAPSGDLVLHTPRGTVRLSRPLAWEIIPGGGNRPLACRWVLRGGETAGLEALSRDPSLALLVDPRVETGALIGTRGTQEIHAVSFGQHDEFYAAGWTDSPSFPTTPGSWDRTQNGGQDAFVALYYRTNGLRFATFLGGEGMDRAWALAVDSGGGMVVGGETLSPDYPTTPRAWDRKPGPKGVGKAFVTRLDDSGATLISSTLAGGKGMDCVRALVLTEKGTALAAGFSNSPDFPVTGHAFQKKPGGGFDIFVLGVPPSGGAPLFSTLFGGEKDEVPQALLLDRQGNILIGGTTSSKALPGAAPRPKPKGGFDALMVKMSPRGEKVLLSTRLGGSKDDQVLAMALGRQGRLYLGGRTASEDFPATAQAYDRTFEACYETGWVACLDKDDAGLVWAGFLGGRHRDFVFGLAVDGKGRVWAAGGTESADYLDIIHPGHKGGTDVFLCALDKAGRKILYDTLMGGSFDDVPGAFDFLPKKGFLIGGWTWSHDFGGLAYPGGELKDGPWGFLLYKAMPTL